MTRTGVDGAASALEKLSGQGDYGKAQRTTVNKARHDLDVIFTVCLLACLFVSRRRK